MQELIEVVGERLNHPGNSLFLLFQGEENGAERIEQKMRVDLGAEHLQFHLPTSGAREHQGSNSHRKWFSQ